MRMLMGLVAVSLCGCVTTKVEVVGVLTPVDTTRPFVIDGPKTGTACGDGAVAGAVNDLFRLTGADGFVAAVVEREVGGRGCVTVTARPVFHGCAARTLGVSPTAQPMRVTPGPAQCEAAADTCEPVCTTYAGRLGGSEFETAAFQNRCLTRCRANDTAFTACATTAATPADVRRCDTLSP